MKKVGIMGGTFNPIHIAHLILAENAYEQFGLDEVIFMPSKRPAYKDLNDVIDEKYRQEMIELAIAGNSHFRIDTMEFYREGNTYTADTLLELTDKNPDVEYYFIIGADSLFQLERWSRPEVVMALSHIVAAKRNDEDDEDVVAKIKDLKEKYNATIDLLKIPQMDISSSMIREKRQQDKSVRYYVPMEVEQYMKENHLYENTDV
ncbi:MAG: nicotinate-nucleotide adenylyltransferase [Clostridiales bacterium]|nr:nicotinate-nucleotide adenylyltransferase [Clostridiales bacterium]